MMRAQLFHLTIGWLILLSINGALSSSAKAHPILNEKTVSAAMRQKAAELAKPPEEFRLSGIDGRSYTLESFKLSPRTTFVSISDTTKTCEQESEAVIQFAKKSMPQDRIVLIHSGLSPDRAKWTEHWNKSFKNVLLLWDPLQILSMRMDLESPGDYFVFDPLKPAARTLGKLADLKARFVQEKPIVTKLSQCREPGDRGIRIAANSTSSEFQEKFALPFMRACVRCHIFSRELDYFESLKQVHGWQAMSLKTIENGRMPAGYEPNPFGHNDLGYTIDDVRLVTRYFQNLAEKKKSEIDHSADYERIYRTENEAQLAAVTKELGQPDLVLQVKEKIHVQASGDLIYRYMMLSEPFTEDRVVRAVVLESDMTVIHHAHVVVLPRQLTETEIKQLERVDSSATAAFQRIFGPKAHSPIRMTANGKGVPGIRLDQPIVATFSRPFRFSLQNPGEGVKVPKGYSLAVILHIESIGKPVTEQPKFQFYFTKPGTAIREISQFTLTPIDLTIPSGKEVRVRSEVDIKEPITLEKFLIHMHHRGVAARVFIQRNGHSKPELVADLPYHLFKLQNFYRFKNVKIASGSKLITELVYDNSTKNTANPDPEKSVNLGKASLDDEMHFPRIFYSK